MGLLDDYSGTSGLAGLGMSPRPSAQHQLIMANLVFRLNLFLFSKKLPYRTCSEHAVWKQGRKDIAPDVIVYKKMQAIAIGDPVVIIEIEKNKNIKRNIEKAMFIMEKIPSIKEAFIYNYDLDVWHHLPSHEASSSCNTFSIDLKEFILPF